MTVPKWLGKVKHCSLTFAYKMSIARDMLLH